MLTTRRFFTATCCILICLFSGLQTVSAQFGSQLKWTEDGEGYYKNENGNIVAYQFKDNQKIAIIDKVALTPTGENEPLPIRDFSFSDDHKKLLIYTNTKKVWRYDTRGDYWVLDIASKKLHQLGKDLPASSLMFAKISPDGTKAAYVSEANIYMEDLASGKVTALTKDGSRHYIYGTFDWVYEEEFGCRDGFRWSPDSKSIAFWHLDARETKDFLMINNTDSLYSFTIPVEYPITGQNPSVCKIGIIDVQTKRINWMQVPGDAQQHYIPRMEWIPGTQEIILQQLSRKQNESILYVCNTKNGEAKPIYKEQDEAWIDVKSRWDNDNIAGWDWLDNGKSFVWVTEKDGWRHLYKVSIDGKKEDLLTPGDYDVIDIAAVDEKGKQIFFHASPNNATQKYLYKVSLKGSKAQMVSPENMPGTHTYVISPGAKYARHSFQNHYFPTSVETLDLKNNKVIGTSIMEKFAKVTAPSNIEFFQVTTEDGVTLDGWINKPKDFDATKKYPVVFYVYGEPAACTVTDTYYSTLNFLYRGNLQADGYISISLDNRGTPAPKGRAWRKSIYRNIGYINARDQAMATKKICEWPFIDKDRIAVWGWSGGGSMTLNLMFQYPQIYKTGIAIAAVTNLLTYDNIYQERYMGLPQETMSDYMKGSPITYAKNLQGNLLFIHGTGDDNVHYANAEMLINELVKHNKQFQMMSYPNRTHSINEGPGTSAHLSQLYTNYLRSHLEPGGK